MTLLEKLTKSNSYINKAQQKSITNSNLPGRSKLDEVFSKVESSSISVSTISRAISARRESHILITSGRGNSWVNKTEIHRKAKKMGSIVFPF